MAPSTADAVPDTVPSATVTSALSAAPAVRSPEASCPSHSAWASPSTSVASAVVATGPGTRAAAASSSIAHRSETVPSAPPCSSGSATPNIPRSASAA